jgi:KaiC/GvpD/RAD55 family RecA-like ATPase
MVNGGIPPELLSILQSDRGCSLLIKGAPGTGKTTLALEILREIGNANGIYLSTRITPGSLYEQFPWLEECVHPVNVIDTTKFYISSEVMFGVQSFPEILYARLGRIERPATIVIDSWDAVIFQSEKREIEALESAIVELARQNKLNLTYLHTFHLSILRRHL